MRGTQVQMDDEVRTTALVLCSMWFFVYLGNHRFIDCVQF
jgi:hypothetical protein